MTTAFDVRCPKCGAPPGLNCGTESGRLRWPHSERRAMAAAWDKVYSAGPSEATQR